MAQTEGCGQFEVGTRRWTECVQDQATGGGLMPWIVVVPLGVMVIGMMIGFARQYSSAGRAKAKAHGAAGTAGSWLIFVSFVELAIGIGSFVAERKAPGVGGGFSIAGTVLTGVGVLLFVIGVYLKIRGRRRARIYHSGVSGEAVIRAVHETGTMVNNQPMYAFDLDVSGQGFAPFTTTHREVVPFWFLTRVGPQSRVPVKVDPSRPTRLIFDWEALAASTPVQSASAIASSLGGAAAAAGAAPGVTPANAAGEAVAGSIMSSGSLAEAMQAAQDLADRRGSGWHAGKAIGLGIALFVLLIVGGGLYFFSQVFGEVSAVTSEFSDQINDAVEDAERSLEGAGGGYGGGKGGGAGGTTGGTTIEVSRKAHGGDPVSFSLALPAAWNDVTAAVPERQGAVLVDVVMKPQTPSEARIVVARSVRYMEDPAPPGAGIASVRKGIEAEFGESLVRSRSVRLGGEAAIALEIAPGADGLRSRQIAVMRGGQLLFVNLTAPKAEWAATLKVFDQVLGSWNWGTTSA
ncbi:MAG TPA: hypothetical protein VEU29_05045 [Actinomycetota bacterium]|nr:hypothetical protein [Actinomycetota bacterium]